MNRPKKSALFRRLRMTFFCVPLAAIFLLPQLLSGFLLPRQYGGGTIPVPTFRNGMMPIQTDSTLWYGSVKGATGNGKYGLIDTTGQYVSRNDFDQIKWRDSRYTGKRGGRKSVVESPWSTLTIYNNEGLLSVIISN